MENKTKIIKKIEEVFAKLPKATYADSEKKHKRNKKEMDNVIKE